MKRNITLTIIMTITLLMVLINNSLVAQFDAETLATSGQMFHKNGSISGMTFSNSFEENSLSPFKSTGKNWLSPARPFPVLPSFLARSSGKINSTYSPPLAHEFNTLFDTAIVGVSIANDGKGIFGVSLSTSSTPNEFGAGVYGQAGAQYSPGVLGTNSHNYGIGVKGQTSGQWGKGVYGESLSTISSFSTPGAGVHGHAEATYSPGVLGTNSAPAGIGVLGKTTGQNGYGVRGEATSETGRYGVYGYTHATETTCYGVYGYAPAAGINSTDRTRGVYGYAAGERSRAIYGSAWGERQDVSKEFCGIYGLVNSTNGYGVYSDGNMGTSGTKAFVQPHPQDPETAVRFICLEGNESGTYFRGSAILQDGYCEIDIPEEWRLVTAEAGITTQITAMGDARVWVDEQHRDYIVIRGTADVAVNYFVNGVRRGFTDYKPYIPNYAFRPEVRNVPFGSQFPQELRDILVANQILNPDYTPNEETASRLGWELIDPEDEDLPAEFLRYRLQEAPSLAKR